MEQEQARYKVLARKYRPKVFKDLIGQEALVRTITNAIEQNRLAQAYILTGIRGIGKTTSARIIAKAINCIGADGHGGMTPNPCGVCKHCQDIANDCHVDVVEIDAASNTGVDNVREIIIEGAKYNPVSGRYKVYIIDEVHMLSKAAFNALLKTLEEPPERLKFIFATTEIRKVPVTILSRCQRFDLRRVDQQALVDYFKTIIIKENATAEEEALHVIAKAADGSVRDGLSLLDQAIVHGNGKITAEQIRQMVGLSDKAFLLNLYEKLMTGQTTAVIEEIENQYNLGTDPLVLAQDLLELTHWLTRVKISPELANDITISEVEKTAGRKLSSSLSMGTLSRTWQILLKGISEIKYAESPIKSLEMLMIRLAYASELPTPFEIITELKKESEIKPAQKKTDFLEKKAPFINEEESSSKGKEDLERPSPLSRSKEIPPEKQLRNLTDIVTLAKKTGQRLLAYNISTYVRPVLIQDEVLHINLDENAPLHLCQDLKTFLLTETGKTWEVCVVETPGGKTLKEEAQENQKLLKETLSAHPLVSKILETFPGSRVEAFHLHRFEKGSQENTYTTEERS